jgi:protein O-mannosyl-transferase
VQNGEPKLAGALAMMLYYAKSLFFPITMISDLGFNAVPLSGWGDWKVWASFLLHGGLFIYALINSRKKDPVAFGILFFYISFSISSNIFITIGTSYGERLVYTSSLGFVLALVFFMYKNLKTSPNLDENALHFLAKSGIFTAIVSVFFLFFAVKTLSRNPAWKDSYTLYETDVQQSSNGAKLNYHYALELTKKGRDEQNVQN